MTNAKTLTDAAINTLRTEAAAAGDTDQVRICDGAIAGDRDAMVDCQRAIDAASDMDDSDD